MQKKFKIKSTYKPAGDQPKAIDQLVSGLQSNLDKQVLLGVTGSGKTFTMANVIAKLQRPALVIAHNKTLAAQLASEFRYFFPENAVEYFVSYYDYYQPEAYLPGRDIYIDKDLQINEEIDRLRHAATAALLSRRDVIVVASVSCIYGLGSPEYYKKGTMSFSLGDNLNRDDFLKKIVAMQYIRSDIPKRGTFRVKGENYEVVRPDRDVMIRIQTQAGRVVNIYEYDYLTGEIVSAGLGTTFIYPAKHFVVPEPIVDEAYHKIDLELEERIKFFEEKGKMIEAERIALRTRHDLEMMKEIGYCKGIENYSLYLSGREIGEAPYTLIDYFSEDFLTFIDESHVTLPQLHAMYGGDYSRKKNLIDYGFRLPSAFDNRPLKFEEFEKKVGQTVFVSATPGEYELSVGRGQVVEQVVRPTGLIDPELDLRPAKNQVKDLIEEIKKVVARDERVLVTALTKKMAENLAGYLAEEDNLKAEYLHSEVDTVDRIRIIDELRKGKVDVLVGVNLLREGLDIPEVSLVAILDADKEGFLRSETSLIQTIGRAARNVRGRVILYADEITGSMKRAIKETQRRRKLQLAYNEEHGITPQTVKKSSKSLIDFNAKEDLSKLITFKSQKDLKEHVVNREQEMIKSAKNLEFERAAIIRDEINSLKKLILKN